MQPDRPDVRELADRFMAAEKKLAGLPGWGSDDEHGAKRAVYPVEIGGELPGPNVVVKAYPGLAGPKFRIMLIFDLCIWRLDFTDDDDHVNPLNPPTGAPGGAIEGPHYHCWLDNRHLATYGALPKRLLVARPLSPKIRRLDQAFRWFCAETKIGFEEYQVPGWPLADRLL